MKKLLLIAILFAGTIVMGQEKEEKLTLKKGTWSLGGEIAFSTANSELPNISTEKNKFTSFNVSPKVGYFISSNLEIGLGSGYSYSKNEDINLNSTKNNSYSVFPYVKKYIPLHKNFSFFLQGEARYSVSESDYNNNLNTGSGNTFFAGIRPGIVYFFTENLAMQANIGALGYTTSKFKSEGVVESTSNSFSFNLNSSNLLFGFSYYF